MSFVKIRLWLIDTGLEKHLYRFHPYIRIEIAGWYCGLRARFVPWMRADDGDGVREEMSPMAQSPFPIDCVPPCTLIDYYSRKNRLRRKMLWLRNSSHSNSLKIKQIGYSSWLPTLADTEGKKFKNYATSLLKLCTWLFGYKSFQ